MTNTISITDLIEARSNLDLIRSKIALCARQLMRNPNDTDVTNELSVWLIAEDEAMNSLNAVIEAHAASH